ncbi:MAG: hypothetical protein II672_04255 [Oscillospiraceae bacterium]|nr:hypothetical protein [Oscillospiraceae bacterium]
MSDNWILQNISKALQIWNEKLAEILELLYMPLQNFRNGVIWNVILTVHSSLQAVGFALLVLFFQLGILNTSGSHAELKRPETVLKAFFRFAAAKAAVTYSMDILQAIMQIGQGINSRMLGPDGFVLNGYDGIPQELEQAVENCGFLESVPLWAVTLIGGLIVWVLSFLMILDVYGRFFRIYLYMAIAPVPLSAFAGEPTQSMGIGFLRSFAAVCLEGAVTALSCVIFSAYASSPPTVDPAAAPAAMVWSWYGELIFDMLILVGTVRLSDRVVREITGI